MGGQRFLAIHDQAIAESGATLLPQEAIHL